MVGVRVWVVGWPGSRAQSPHSAGQLVALRAWQEWEPRALCTLQLSSRGRGEDTHTHTRILSLVGKAGLESTLFLCLLFSSAV